MPGRLAVHTVDRPAVLRWNPTPATSSSSPASWGLEPETGVWAPIYYFIICLPQQQSGIVIIFSMCSLMPFKHVPINTFWGHRTSAVFKLM